MNMGQGEKTTRQILTKNEKLFMSIGDLLMIVMILADLLYLGDIIELPGNELFFLNILVVSISFVIYQMKKRVRKRKIREILENKRVDDV